MVPKTYDEELPESTDPDLFNTMDDHKEVDIWWFHTIEENRQRNDEDTLETEDNDERNMTHDQTQRMFFLLETIPEENEDFEISKFNQILCELCFQDNTLSDIWRLFVEPLDDILSDIWRLFI
uniref:Uncharacterized protein n=1 Tax=Ananas comosus var. bracteatus TaxID=296719 RepID=A0A6V7Q3U8_ANACO|nr:unnamed protein product [Ananas comosus var. bracteatus]